MLWMLNRVGVILFNLLLLLLKRNVLRKRKSVLIVLAIAGIVVDISYLFGTFRTNQGFFEWLEFAVVILMMIDLCMEVQDALSYLRKKDANSKMPLIDNKGNRIGWLPSENEQFKINLKKAKQGDAISMLNLALFYKNGAGCRRNLRCSYKWALKAINCDTTFLWVKDEAKLLLPQIEKDIEEDVTNAFSDIVDFIQNIFG